jgi:deoxyribodipyrimidine photolyase
LNWNRSFLTKHAHAPQNYDPEVQALPATLPQAPNEDPEVTRYRERVRAAGEARVAYIIQTLTNLHQALRLLKSQLLICEWERMLTQESRADLIRDIQQLLAIVEEHEAAEEPRV